MNVREMLNRKSERVVTIAPEASVSEAMRLLVRHNIGAVVVVTGSTIRGILTERDLLRAGAEDPRRLSEGKVEELMTRDVITAPESLAVREVMDIMTERRIRHLPITRGDEMCGILSIGDVVNALRQSTETENRYLHAYIAGTPL
jgi:CBS domain-containing protein